MSGTKFTPGPWRVEVGQDYYAPSMQPHVYVSSEETVCAATVVATMGTYGGIALEQKQANAHLIAAAPELYEALERALNFIANTESEFGIQLDSGDAARAALRKARGEAQ